jgi:anti-sigma B factor antagonist
MRTFSLNTNERRPGCLEIQVDGELDLAVADRLQEALDGASAYDEVLLDLRKCEFIDSTGLAVIVNAHKQRAERGGRVALFGASSQVSRVLAVTGLDQNGLVFATADEALAAPTTKPA